MELEQLYTIFAKYPSISTDSRNVAKNSIFFALKGENFNGNKFSGLALQNGAAYAIIDEKQYYVSERTIVVDDVLKTLQLLANYHRKQFTIPFIGITGTNGKTTTKELIQAVLSSTYRTSATIGNLNNHIGVPLTLLKIESNTEIAIVEMGANHQNEIEHLCEIAEPEIGLITNIGKAHLEGFGSFKGVIKAKSELYDYIKLHNGTLICNRADSLLNELAGDYASVGYGEGPDSLVKARMIKSDPFLEIELSLGKKNMFVKSKLTGAYNLNNLLAAVAIGIHFRVSAENIKAALEIYEPTNNRSQLLRTRKNTLILDAYNANPSSMKLAIDNLVQLDSKNKYAILGDMLELGIYSEEEHLAVVEQLRTAKLKNVVLVGKHFRKSAEAYAMIHCQDAAEAKIRIESMNIDSATILIKGSRGIQLEKVVDVL
jgi:UDP-N-acetylmuramoyl-tripeptide--D-alanyl-D-alanine ligase